MININLLPWREEQRRTQRQLMIRHLLTAAVITLLLMFIIYFFSASRHNGTHGNINILQQETVKVTQQINQLAKYTKLEDELALELDALRELQLQRYALIILFNELPGALPQSTYIDKITKKDNSVSIFGHTTSNQQITQFIEGLSKSNYLQQPVLNESKTDTSTQPTIIRFEVNTLFTKPVKISKASGKKDDSQKTKK